MDLEICLHCNRIHLSGSNMAEHLRKSHTYGNSLVRDRDYSKLFSFF